MQSFSRPRLTRQLQTRLGELGLCSFDDYLSLWFDAERGEAERREAIGLLTVQETRFFRAAHQLRMLESEILAAIVGQGDAPFKHLRLWSAGCASGEESYSLAMLLEAHPLLQRWSFEILGTDLSRQALGRAERARYSSERYQSVPERYRPYLLPSQKEYEVAPALRQRCRFALGNLLKPECTPAEEPFDVVFCRNVLMYFGSEARALALQHLHQRMRPGAYLVLGPYETLIEASTLFDRQEGREDVVFRRR